jgi:hypothetical protein
LYCTDWYNQAPGFKRLLPVAIMRASNSVKVKAGVFFDMSCVTLASVSCLLCTTVLLFGNEFAIITRYDGNIKVRFGAFKIFHIFKECIKVFVQFLWRQNNFCIMKFSSLIKNFVNENFNMKTRFYSNCISFISFGLF